MPEFTFPSWSLGSIIAIVVLILCIVLMVIGQIPVVIGGMIAGLAVARLT